MPADPTYTAHFDLFLDGREAEVTVEYTVTPYRPQRLNEPAEWPAPEITDILIDGEAADALRFEEIVEQVDHDWLIREAEDQAQDARLAWADHQLMQRQEARA